MQGMDILIVEDDNRVLRGMVALLGLEHNVTPHFYRGIDNLPAGKYDLAVLDRLDGAWDKVAETLEGRCDHIVINTMEPQLIEGSKYPVLSKSQTDLTDYIRQLPKK
jgi:hypothetical protein